MYKFGYFVFNIIFLFFMFSYIHIVALDFQYFDLPRVAWPFGIDLTCRRARFASALVLKHFVIALSTNLVHTSTLPLLQ